MAVENKNEDLYVQYPSIYHYTTIKNALSIIDNGIIYATSPECLNDSEEIEIGKKIFDNECKNDFAQFLNKEDSLGKFFITCFSIHHDSSKELHINKFVHENGLLSQWHRYSGEMGVCLGFDTKKILSELEKLHKEGKIPLYGLIDVCYVDGDNYAPFLDEERKIFINEANQKPNEGKEIFLKIFENHVKFIISVKNYGFNEEKEIRLVCFLTFFDREEERNQLPIKYQKRIEIPIDIRSVLTEIIVHPSASEKTIEYIKGELLRRRLNGVNVFKSKIPYRDN